MKPSDSLSTISNVLLSFKQVAHSADRHLQEIDKQYPGFVNMKSHAGLQYSYELQVLLQKLDDSSIVRGYRYGRLI